MEVRLPSLVSMCIMYVSGCRKYLAGAEKVWCTQILVVHKNVGDAQNVGGVQHFWWCTTIYSHLHFFRMSTTTLITTLTTTLTTTLMTPLTTTLITMSHIHTISAQSNLIWLIYSHLHFVTICSWHSADPRCTLSMTLYNSSPLVQHNPILILAVGKICPSFLADG